MNPGSNTPRSPDFIIIGAMKCMTSTLHEQLAAQPGFYMTEPKEPCYFSNDEVYSRGPEWYHGLFRGAKPGDVCGESSTHYTKLPTYPHTLERMYDHAPEAKLIYVMRDPIERLVSQYVHEWTVRRVSCPIDQAIEELPELIEYGKYAYQLRPFLSVYGPERVLPVFFERLSKSPNLELERIRTFLGLSQSLAWKPQLANENRSNDRIRKSAWRDALVHAPGLSWVRRRLVPQTVRDRIKAYWKLPEKPRVCGELRERLERVYDEDLKQLGDWFGVSILTSSFREVVAEQSLDWRADLDLGVGSGRALPREIA